MLFSLLLLVGMFIRVCCTWVMVVVLCCSLSLKFTVGLSVVHVLVLAVRLGLLPVSSGMSSPSVSTTMCLLASSSGCGIKAACMIPFFSSPSAFFMSHSSHVDVNDEDLGLFLGWDRLFSCVLF